MKTCKHCQAEFQPARPMQSVCSPICAAQKVKADRKAEKAELKRRKLSVLTRSDWMKKAQVSFNAYIRARDRDLPCISCGTTSQTVQYHAGHYLSTGARPNLRFCETNVAKQCAQCNTHLSGNLISYRLELINRVGLQEVERLERDHVERRYTIDGLQEIVRQYREFTKELLK